MVWFGLSFGNGAFMLQLARESKAGRPGTFVLLPGLGFGMPGFAAKGLIKYFMAGMGEREKPARPALSSLKLEPPLGGGPGKPNGRPQVCTWVVRRPRRRSTHVQTAVAAKVGAGGEAGIVTCQPGADRADFVGRTQTLDRDGADDLLQHFGLD